VGREGETYRKSDWPNRGNLKVGEGVVGPQSRRKAFCHKREGLEKVSVPIEDCEVRKRQKEIAS